MQTTEQPKELTTGMIVMNYHFNPSGRNDVNDIKRRCAEIYDWLQAEIAKPYSPADISTEKTKMEMEKQRGRLCAVALTHLETFQMNAVKAVTYTKEITEDKYKSIFSLPVPTDGYLAMTLDFNFTSREDVAYIKKTAADLMDDMEREMRWRDILMDEAKAENDTRWTEKEKQRFDALTVEEQTQETEVKKQQRNFTSIPWDEETILLHRKNVHAKGAMGEALFALRQFQMYAVKAVTR